MRYCLITLVFLLNACSSSRSAIDANRSKEGEVDKKLKDHSLEALFSPVKVRANKDTVLVGCESVGCKSLQDDPPFDNLMFLKGSISNMETLLANVIDSMEPEGAAKADVKVIKQEQRIWTRARDKYCRDITKGFSSDDMELANLYCQKWTVCCRLEDMLSAYDRLVPYKE